jgi:hypothetical protein
MRSRELYKKPVSLRITDNDPVRAMFHKAMGHILGEMLEEDSTIGDTVRSSPYSDVLVRAVHEKLKIAHDQKWKKTDKVSWKDVKASSPNFVILAGSRGTAAVRWNGGNSMWYVITANGEGTHPYTNSSINAVMVEIKEDIGMITGSYEAVGEGTRSYYRAASDNAKGSVDAKREKRKVSRTINKAGMLDPAAGMEQNLGAIQKKLRPLYTRYIEQAMADVKGVIGMQLKADAHDRASQKIQILKNLKAMLVHIEDNPNSIPDDVAKKLKPALYMTAAYFYPEETGDIRKSYGSISSENSAGPRQVVKDIANGDGKKLAAMMNFFKQSLLH